MRRCGLFLVKVLLFEVDNRSPKFLRWIRVPLRQLTQTPTIFRPVEEDMSTGSDGTILPLHDRRTHPNPRRGTRREMGRG